MTSNLFDQKTAHTTAEVTISKDSDLRALTDNLRQAHDVIKNDAGEWVLLRHADVVAAALDDERFSSQVSRFLQVPNGLDGAEHEHFRALIDSYLSKEALLPYVPVFDKVATELMSELPKGKMLNAVDDIGAVFAVRAQCAWLGWPTKLEPRLLEWMRDNHSATRSKDNVKMAQVAQDFDDIIRSVISSYRNADEVAGMFNASTAENNIVNNVNHSLDRNSVTAQLCHERIDGRELSEAELVSILRNWTGGDLGSIALCVGVIIAHIVKHPEQVSLWSQAADSELEAIIDEILRIDDPFVSNRRITTCPVSIGAHKLPKGARVQLNWTSANRDEAVFADNSFDPQKHAAVNVVYGIGKHVCPGRLLATWQLRMATQALLTHFKDIQLAAGFSLEREQPPLGGYSHVPVVLG
ncbi:MULTISPECIES: cytochrome P450 [unclassified Psychrobacter]|uniref:cytochrome P450 n=1 Tax=unclassified Psychrobacter TaxID=196806 RepID=UPI0025F4EC89|nr:MULTISPECIES: cytochrome P450 [unclassified Psychrobacter]